MSGKRDATPPEVEAMRRFKFALVFIVGIMLTCVATGVTLVLVMYSDAMTR